MSQERDQGIKKRPDPPVSGGEGLRTRVYRTSSPKTVSGDEEKCLRDCTVKL